MTTRASRSGQGGRPRTFQDVDIFAAATRVLAQVGYGQLTLDAVAVELGCTAPAISRRFGSKRGLVSAYLDWTIAGIHERFQQAGSDHSSPLDALRARVLIPAAERTEELGDPSNQDRAANLATFWTSVRADSEFRVRANEGIRASERDAAELLRLAIDAGELSGCDPVDLGALLIAAWSGTTSLWPGDGPNGTLEQRLLAVFETIISPYRR